MRVRVEASVLSLTTTTSNPPTTSSSANGWAVGCISKPHLPSRHVSGRWKPQTRTPLHTVNPLELAKHLHTAFMLGVPTHRSIFSISVVITRFSSNLSEKPVFFETADNSATRPFHLAIAPTFSQRSTRLSNSGFDTVKNWHPWSNCTCLPSSRSTLRVAILPPTPLPASNTVTLNPCLESSSAQTNPEIPAPITAALLVAPSKLHPFSRSSLFSSTTSSICADLGWPGEPRVAFKRQAIGNACTRVVDSLECWC
mmetsp:Transcript_2811/g.4738  ORF Transcript_2811/g.4738 Transcript_2811/m.4738 type:complete len:255 (+) Transcript_2811:807-1571(+)